MANEAEAFALEHELVGLEAPVAQDHPTRLRFAAASAQIGGAGLAHQGDRHRLGIDEIAESRLDRFRARVVFGELHHEGSFGLTKR